MKMCTAFNCAQIEIFSPWKIAWSCSDVMHCASFFFVCVYIGIGIHSSGIEGNPTVFYRLMPGSTAQTNKFHTFYLQQRPDNGDTWADIKVNHPLDYESIKEYNLTIRVEVSAVLLKILSNATETYARNITFQIFCYNSQMLAYIAIIRNKRTNVIINQSSVYATIISSGYIS